jgi:hypothetical protein
MAFNIIATVTDQGRQRIAEQLKTGKAFAISKFTVSDGGHSVGDPTVALAPNPAAITCPLNTYSYGPIAINAATLVSAFCPQFTCVLTTGEANAPLSSLCLIATIVYSPVLDDPDIGEDFLFAIGNYPLKVKTGSDTFTYNCLIQL